MREELIVAAAGFLGGAMNALAGGGSFVTLPALIAVGLPSVQANASSSVALYPGGVASAIAYRKGSRGKRPPIPMLAAAAISIVAGLLGSLLLLMTPTRLFDDLLPWLLLVATFALAFGPALQERIHSRLRSGTAVLLSGQFLLGLYGGYFGGAVGIMTLAFWSLILSAEIRDLQYPRILLVTASNTAAVVAFAVAGAVSWGMIAVMAPATILGGYGGALLGRGLKESHVRAATILLAVFVTVAFFVRAYG